MTVSIRLSDEDLAVADEAARRRQEYADAQGIRDADGFTGDGLAIHRAGARAEVAVARYLGAEWTAFAEAFQAIEADVGDLQVRSTDWVTGRLRVRPSDREDQPFVLVRTHLDPLFVLVGWAYGGEAKDRAWWERPDPSRPGCYLVPNDRLRPMTFLPRAPAAR